jgi:hypothetical protein
MGGFGKVRPIVQSAPTGQALALSRNRTLGAAAMLEDLSCGDVAQLEEHLLCKQGVVGSSPIISTTSTTSLLSRGADGPSLG